MGRSIVGGLGLAILGTTTMRMTSLLKRRKARTATAGDLGLSPRDGGAEHQALLTGIAGGVAPTNSTIQSFERILDLLYNGDAPMPGTPLYATVEQAMRLAVVYRCVGLIAGHVMQCPIRLYESVVKKGKRELVPTMQDLEWTLNTRPEARFTGPLMIEYQTASMLLYGDGYSEVVRDGMGEPAGLLQYHPGDVQCGQDKATGRLAYAMTRRNADGSQGETVYRDQEDVIDWQNMLHNGYSAPSTIRRSGASAVTLAQSLEGSMHKFLREGNMQKLILRHVGAEFNREQKREFLEGWRDSYGRGIDGRNIPMVLDGNWDTPQTISVSPEDAQMLEMRQFAVSDIGRLFGVPDIMLNQSEKASSWGSGTLVIVRNFMRTTVNPILRRYEAELSAKLAPFGTRLAVRFDTSALLRASATERAAHNRAALGGGQNSGWMSVNEIREAEGLPPKEGEEYDNIHIGDASAAADNDEEEDKDKIMDDLKQVDSDKDANAPDEQEQERE